MPRKTLSQDARADRAAKDYVRTHERPSDQDAALLDLGVATDEYKNATADEREDALIELRCQFERTPRTPGHPAWDEGARILGVPAERPLSEYTREELIKAIGDLTDGQARWHDIRDQTGLGEKRCREVAALAALCLADPAYAS